MVYWLRVLLAVVVSATTALGFGQLIAHQVSYDTQDPQDNQSLAERMIGMPNGDVVISSCSGGGPGTIYGTLRLRRLTEAGSIVWTLEFADSYKDDSHRPSMLYAGGKIHYFHPWNGQWYVINAATGAIENEQTYSPTTAVVAMPDGQLAELIGNSIYLRSPVTNTQTWFSDVGGSMATALVMRLGPDDHLYVGGSYYDPNTLVSNGLCVSKIGTSGGVVWTGAAGNQDFPPTPDEPGDIVVDLARDAVYVTAAQNFNSYDDDLSVTKFDLWTGQRIWNCMIDLGGNEVSRQLELLSDGSLVSMSQGRTLIGVSPGGSYAWSFNAGSDYSFDLGRFVVNSRDQIFVITNSYGNRPDYEVAQINGPTGTNVKNYRFDIGGLEVATDIAVAPDGNVLVNGTSRAGGFRIAVLVKFQEVNVTVTPTTVNGGANATATLKLVGTAPHAYTIPLATTNSSAASPAVTSVTLTTGQSQKTFTVRTTATTSPTNATIYGYHWDNQVFSSFGSTITVAPTTMSSFSLTPSSMVGGTLITGTVNLSSPAPPGGITYYLADNSAYSTVDSVGYIGTGQTTGTFFIETKPVASTTNVLVFAHYAGTTLSKGFQLTAPSLAVVTAPATIYSGASAIGTVTISGNAPPGGWSIALSDDSTALTVSGSTTVPAGSNTTTYNIIAGVVTSNTTVTISAKRGSTTKTTTIIVKPPIVSSFSLLPDSLTGGQTTTALIVLSSPAPTGGLTVTIQNGAPSKVTTPSTLFIPAGASSRSFTVSTQTVTTPITVGIYATLNGTTVTRYLYLLP